MDVRIRQIDNELRRGQRPNSFASQLTRQDARLVRTIGKLAMERFPDERNGLVGRINVETKARARLGATNERDKGNRTAERSGQIGLTTMWFIAASGCCERWLILYPLFERGSPIGVRTMIKAIDGYTARERARETGLSLLENISGTSRREDSLYALGSSERRSGRAFRKYFSDDADKL